jgi:hypothetical protein
VTGDEILDYLIEGALVGLAMGFITWLIVHFVAGFFGFMRRHIG